jgi:hypothetical protein
MRSRQRRRDFAGALELAEAILACDPRQDAARQCADLCRRNLFDSYAAQFGSLERVPVRLTPLSQVDGRHIDHRAAFVLDALRILHDLANRRIIALRCRTLRPAATVVESGVRERIKKEKG